jgi:hypothetical protein
MTKMFVTTILSIFMRNLSRYWQIISGSTHRSDSRRDNAARGVKRIRVSRRAATFLLMAASHRFYGDQGARQGVTGARHGMRHEGAVQEGEEGKGTKGRERVVRKRWGTSALYTWRKVGRQMRSADEGSHEVATPDRVIHR